MSQIHGPDPFDGSNPFSQDTLDMHAEDRMEVMRFRDLHESIEAKLLELTEAEQVTAASGVTLGVVLSASDLFNATYTIGAMPGAPGQLPPLEMMGFVVPQGRMFDIADVDFHAASVGALAVIHPLPLQKGFAGPWYSSAEMIDPLGACMGLDGSCFPEIEANCVSGISGTFMGVGAPCGAVYLAENVKISVCPTPSLPAGATPPRELLSPQPTTLLPPPPVMSGDDPIPFPPILPPTIPRPAPIRPRQRRTPPCLLLAQPCDYGLDIFRSCMREVPPRTCDDCFAEATLLCVEAGLDCPGVWAPPDVTDCLDCAQIFGYEQWCTPDGRRLSDPEV